MRQESLRILHVRMRFVPPPLLGFPQFGALTQMENNEKTAYWRRYSSRPCEMVVVRSMKSCTVNLFRIDPVFSRRWISTVFNQFVENKWGKERALVQTCAFTVDRRDRTFRLYYGCCIAFRLKVSQPQMGLTFSSERRGREKDYKIYSLSCEMLPKKRNGKGERNCYCRFLGGSAS